MLSSHESCTHSPTYLVVFELGVNTRENQFFATNYLFKQAGHLLKPPVLHHGILHFSDRLSALFSRFRCETEEIKREGGRGGSVSAGITKKAQGCPLGTIPEPIPLCQYGWKKVVKIRGTISSNPSYFAIEATSAAKSSTFFSMPSPFSKRVNLTSLISPPSSFATSLMCCSTETLFSLTNACWSRQFSS